MTFSTIYIFITINNLRITHLQIFFETTYGLAVFFRKKRTCFLIFFFKTIIHNKKQKIHKNCETFMVWPFFYPFFEKYFFCYFFSNFFVFLKKKTKKNVKKTARPKECK